MVPSSFHTTRTARYISLGEPGTDIQHVWFCLHGEGQPLADFAAQLVNFDTPERLLILPEGLSRYALPAAAGATPTTAATWFAPDSLLADLSDLTTYLDELAAQILAQCPEGVPVTVLGYGHGAAAACRWLSSGRTRYDRLLLYASIFPPTIDRRATLVSLPERPVTLISTTTEAFTPEATGEALLQDMQDAGLKAQLRYVSEGPLTLAALGTVGK
ncbi:phospholipase [Hymenobacter sp. NST-14]|uniref:phospholipase n=1 Tax=Hymenobacter piscis TaxID=2839984 RepID=UPI001C019509|nr:phospholipase [Hymenobacter piscis]MBT9392940.1 phospholipase [Hymenobacter piscis]